MVIKMLTFKRNSVKDIEKHCTIFRTFLWIWNYYLKNILKVKIQKVVSDILVNRQQISIYCLDILDIYENLHNG